jgi:hypothetical protein
MGTWRRRRIPVLAVAPAALWLSSAGAIVGVSVRVDGSLTRRASAPSYPRSILVGFQAAKERRQEGARVVAARGDRAPWLMEGGKGKRRIRIRAAGGGR